MTTILPPTRQLMNPETEIVTLCFPPGSIAPDGEYWIRGGVCWPRRVEGYGFAGFAVLGGLHLASQTVYIFEQHEFSVIAPWKDESGKIQPWPDAVNYFNRCWTTYFCQTHYWHGEFLVRRTNVLEVEKCDLINPKPIFSEVDWNNPENALAAVSLLGASRRLVHKGLEGACVKQAIERNVADAKLIDPALEALMALVTGLGRKIGVRE